jgi:hypothetical protein
MTKVKARLLITNYSPSTVSDLNLGDYLQHLNTGKESTIDFR